MPSFASKEVQEIMNNKALKEDYRVLAIRTNYCNCLFNCYKYDDAITALKKLVVILEGQVNTTYQVYPQIVETKKTNSSMTPTEKAQFHQRVHQLVCNYYLLGNRG